MQKVINLFAGPGAGKSTMACGLFYHMKTAGLKVELVREYIKESVWEGRQSVIDDQMYIFGKQNRRQHILDGQVDWIVTDAPLLLSAVYCEDKYNEIFASLCLDAHSKYDNYNYFLRRRKPYVSSGRSQTHDEAVSIDKRMRKFLLDNKIKFDYVDGDPNGLYQILSSIGVVVR